MTDVLIPAADVPPATVCDYCGRANGEVTYSTLNGVPYGPPLVVADPMYRSERHDSDGAVRVAWTHLGCAWQQGYDLAEAYAAARPTA